VYDNSKTEPSVRFRLGTHDQPFYLFAGYDSNEHRLLGQPLGNFEILSGGFGVYHTFDKVRVFAELGYGEVDVSVKQFVQDEIIPTKLEARHTTPSTPPPADRPLREGNFQGLPANDSYTSYEIDGGFLGRVGVEWQVLKHVRVSASYRYMTGEEHYEWWDDSKRFGEHFQGWWQDTNAVDLSAWEAGIVVNF
jgi:hypothetical protein